MPANECPALSSPMPDDRTANRVPGGAESIHGSVAQRRISASVAPLAITKPSGTGNPACFSRAQLNALPPTRGRSSEAIASSVFNARRATLSGLPRSRVGSVAVRLGGDFRAGAHGRSDLRRVLQTWSDSFQESALLSSYLRLRDRKRCTRQRAGEHQKNSDSLDIPEVRVCCLRLATSSTTKCDTIRTFCRVVRSISHHCSWLAPTRWYARLR